MLDKIKLYGSILLGLIISVLTFEFVRRGQKIDELNHENSAHEANELTIKEEQELKNEKQEADKVDVQYNQNVSNLDKSIDELERLKSNRPK